MVINWEYVLRDVGFYFVIALIGAVANMPVCRAIAYCPEFWSFVIQT